MCMDCGLATGHGVWQVVVTSGSSNTGLVTLADKAEARQSVKKFVCF